jgi:Fic family protein
MKLPENAPDWLTIIKDNISNLFSQGKFTLFNEYINTVDQREDYLYWDKFKYLEIPEGMTPELAWSYLKLSRQSKAIKTALASKDSKVFSYWMPDGVLRNLSEIDKYIGGQILIDDEAPFKRPEHKRFLVNSLMEEAIASSQLEGAATTRRIAKEMLRTGRKPRNHPEQMIYNNYQTILRIKDFIHQPLNEQILLDLHKSMTAGTLEKPDWSGRFRMSTDEPIHVGDKEGVTLYVPPPPEKIVDMLKILYDYANKDDAKRFVHPVIKATNLHFYLSYIHPFNDGNGRTARALFYWYMLNKKYWMMEYLTISSIFIKAPAQYARAFLYTEMDDLDLTYFISFNKLIEYIRNKQKEVAGIGDYFKKYPELNERQRDLLRHAIDNPDSQFTIETHLTINNVTYETARKDLLSLQEKGLLDKVKKGRKFYFIPTKRLLKIVKLG